MSRHRNIEEEFRAIAPAGHRGIPAAQPIAVGVSGSGSAGASGTMSQASQEISQLQAQFKQQSSLLQANTQALQNNTTAHGQSAMSAIGGAATGILGGGLGLLSPIVSGIMSLFGIGGKSAPPAPTFYYAPPSVQLSDTLRAATPSSINGSGNGGAVPAVPAAKPGGGAQNITVNVNAMDSQSFMDRSNDIASAVREAMLNLHPINDVVASL